MPCLSTRCLLCAGPQVSHGEIRYEGLLANVDMPNSTIALSNGELPGSKGSDGAAAGVAPARRQP